MKKFDMVNRNMEIRLTNLFNHAMKKKNITYHGAIRDFFHNITQIKYAPRLMRNDFYLNHYSLYKLFKPLEITNNRYIMYMQMINSSQVDNYIVVKMYSSFHKGDRNVSDFVAHLTNVNLFDVKFTDTRDDNKDHVNIFYEFTIPIVGVRPLIKKDKHNNMNIKVDNDEKLIYQNIIKLNVMRNNIIDKQLSILRTTYNKKKNELDLINDEITKLESSKIKI